jgi:hypothetical protein
VIGEKFPAMKKRNALKNIPEGTIFQFDGNHTSLLPPYSCLSGHGVP